MSEISQEALEFIKYATSMEIGGRSFYEHAAERTTNDHGKQVFKKLAQDEIGHITAFGAIFTEVLGTDSWEQYIDKEETGTQTSRRCASAWSWNATV
jgi:rubrerythrin